MTRRGSAVWSEIIDVFEPVKSRAYSRRGFQPVYTEIPIVIENAIRHALGLQRMTPSSLARLMQILERAIARGQDSICLHLIMRTGDRIQTSKVVYSDIQKLKTIFDVYKGYLAVRKQIRRVERHLARVARAHRRLEKRFQAFQVQVARVVEKAENLPAFRLVKEQEQVREKVRELMHEITSARERIERTLEVTKKKKGMLERAKEFVKSAVSKFASIIASPFSIFSKKKGGPGGRRP